MEKINILNLHRLYILALIVFLSSGKMQAQIETDKIFPFLNQSTSGRMSALGGVTIAEIGPDINQVYANPALFSAEEKFPLSFNHQFHFLGTGIGNVAAGKKLRWRDLSVYGGIQYAGYPAIDGYDEQGQPLGTQSANDYNILAGVSGQLYANLRLGANLKFITSNLAGYRSNAVGLDLGAAYHVPDATSTLGFAIKNLGAQLSYYGAEREPMPVEVQASGSVRLRHLPLRIGVLAHHLQRWNLLYENPYDIEQSFSFDDQFASLEARQYGFVDNFFRHLIFQAEMSLGKNEGFKLRMAYNHFKKRELTVNGFRSLAGFSGGLGLRIYKFSFDYGLSVYHIAGTTHTLTVSTDLAAFGRKGL